MNRIIQSQVSGQAQQTFAYDAVGNLTQKTGVGAGTANSIVYPQQGVNGTNAIRPNAIQSVTGGVYGTGSYTYDDNGNLANGAGRSLTWTSFDMPLSVAKAATGTGSSATPAASATFTYGPEHQRTRQIKTEGSTTTTVIYAGAQEVETKSGVTTIKTYWPHGVGVEIDRNLSGSANPNNNVSELNWTHTDRLGSPVAMSTSTGILREKLAYDAWGKRRTLDGAPITTADGGSNSATPTPDTIDGATDNRGFTGHEMLDGLDLVHMNGRIYDPLTARFMSADPILQDPMNGQSYNRYSYVMNNPTNLVDPTGYEWTDYVPVVGPILEFKQNVGDGRFGMAAVNATFAVFDGATLGVGSLITAPIRQIIKAEVKHELATQLAKEGAEQAARATATATRSVEQNAVKQSAERGADAAATKEAKAATGSEKAKLGGGEKAEAPASKADIFAAIKTQGKEAEAETRAALGETKRGEQVTFRTSDGTRARPDFVTGEKGKTPTGITETKSGDAPLSKGQAKLKADIEAGRPVTPVGRNAEEAGFTPGKPVIFEKDSFKTDRR